MPVGFNGKAQPQDPGPSPTGYPPSDALVWVVEQDTDDIQQAGEELEGEVEQPDPQACGEGRDIRAVKLRGAGPPTPLGSLNSSLLKWPCMDLHLTLAFQMQRTDASAPHTPPDSSDH